MSITFKHTRTPAQIAAEADKLAARIPSLTTEDAQILAQSSITIPVEHQDARLYNIIRTAVFDEHTHPVVKKAMRQWLNLSWNDSFKDRIRAAANQ